MHAQNMWDKHYRWCTRSTHDITHTYTTKTNLCQSSICSDLGIVGSLQKTTMKIRQFTTFQAFILTLLCASFISKGKESTNTTGGQYTTLTMTSTHE